MKEVVVYEGPRAILVDSPIPKAKAGQVVIKVEVSGTNPKDWKTEWVANLPINMGDDFAGTIHDIGTGVADFRCGDRVFAFHQISTPHGSYAEYAVAWAYTTCHLSDAVTYEEASTIPLAGLTAAQALYRTLALPAPWSPAVTETSNTTRQSALAAMASFNMTVTSVTTEEEALVFMADLATQIVHLAHRFPIIQSLLTEYLAQLAATAPILIYGGSSAVGAFAIKLAIRSNLHPIIAIAGAGGSYVSSLLDTSKGDVLIDYRNGLEATEAEIRNALREYKGLSFALDAISCNGSSRLCAAVLQNGGKLAHVLPLEEGVDLSGQKTASLVMVGDVHGTFGEDRAAREFGNTTMKYFGKGLEEGWFKGHPYEVVPGGLGAVGKILEDLKAGKASAKKYVFRIRETEGV